MSMMMRRGMMVPKAPGGLPAEYLAVQYLEGTGTQYIDTGVLFNQGLKIMTEMCWTNLSGTQALMGARADTGATRFLLTYYSNQVDYAYGYDRTYGTPTVNTYYNFIFDTTIDGTFKYGITGDIKTASVAAVNTNTTGYIFAYHRGNDDAVLTLAKARCKSFVIEDASGNNIRDFIPCIRISDSKPGMYDLVGRQFYTNQGTGEFIYPGNIWDEQWEQGGYDTTTGQKGTAVSGQIRSKNAIIVSPGTDYYVYVGNSVNVRCLYYQADGTFISVSEALNNAVITTPANAGQMRFHTGSSYGDTYNNNISINYPSTDHDYHEHI